MSIKFRCKDCKCEFVDYVKINKITGNLCKEYYKDLYDLVWLSKTREWDSNENV